MFRGKLCALLVLLLAGSAANANEWLTFGHDPERSGWNRAEQTLSPKNGESLALRATTVSTVADKQLMGRLRYVPSLKSFVISDNSTLPAQLLRPAAFA